MLIGILLVRFRLTLTRRGIENINMFVFLQLLTPFVTYLVAELFHASGIIAAVVAGLVHGFERDRIAQTRTRLQLSYKPYVEYFRLCVKWFCILNTWLLSAGSHCKNY